MCAKNAYYGGYSKWVSEQPQSEERNEGRKHPSQMLLGIRHDASKAALFFALFGNFPASSTVYSPSPSSNGDRTRGTGGTPLLRHAEGKWTSVRRACDDVREMAALAHESAERAKCRLSRRFTEETPPYPIWSGKLVGGDEGRLWATSHSDEMEKDCGTKNVSKNAQMDFVQMRDAEGRNWETETVMKDDGATKTSEDKARADNRGHGENTLGNPSGLQFLGSRVTSESGSVHVLLGGKPGDRVGR
ncbi:hypothetical protein BS47DRAFT_1362270 [Hydnum rufescens UP504]|uniref:Uncharacterized protein n=1 Tax=Hydnum rufescens UP504 TaxID=1448309 RepID=A0A9P6AXB2_9AGAM|nr:hypothetical protein BS47DRAFT_1362270 [Hydnum rufescens UP504]